MMLEYPQDCLKHINDGFYRESDGYCKKIIPCERDSSKMYMMKRRGFHHMICDTKKDVYGDNFYDNKRDVYCDQIKVKICHDHIDNHHDHHDHYNYHSHDHEHHKYKCQKCKSKDKCCCSDSIDAKVEVCIPKYCVKFDDCEPKIVQCVQPCIPCIPEPVCIPESPCVVPEPPCVVPEPPCNNLPKPCPKNCSKQCCKPSKPKCPKSCSKPCCKSNIDDIPCDKIVENECLSIISVHNPHTYCKDVVVIW